MHAEISDSSLTMFVLISDGKGIHQIETKFIDQVNDFNGK